MLRSAIGRNRRRFRSGQVIIENVRYQDHEEIRNYPEPQGGSTQAEHSVASNGNIRQKVSGLMNMSFSPRIPA